MAGRRVTVWWGAEGGVLKVRVSAEERGLVEGVCSHIREFFRHTRRHRPVHCQLDTDSGNHVLVRHLTAVHLKHHREIVPCASASSDCRSP